MYSSQNVRENGDSIIALPSRFRYNEIFEGLICSYLLFKNSSQVSSSYFYFYLFVKKK